MYTKYQYLQTSVAGPASDLIKHLPRTEVYYESAEKLSPNLQSLHLPASPLNCSRIVENNIMFSRLQCLKIAKCLVQFLKRVAECQVNGMLRIIEAANN